MILLMTIALATADAPATSATTATPTVTPAPATPKKICKTMAVTGSRLGGGKVCHTAAEWDRIAADAQTELNRMNKPSFYGQ